MFNATKALLHTPVPGPRSAASGARRRVLPHFPAVLPTAAAALISWYLAVLLLPDDRPAFASIAAVICVSISYGKRRWRALELVGGVVLGISISSLLLYLIGSGPFQIALLVILAMTAALLFKGGELLVNEPGSPVGTPGSLGYADLDWNLRVELSDKRQALVAGNSIVPDQKVTATFCNISVNARGAIWPRAAANQDLVVAGSGGQSFVSGDAQVLCSAN